MRCRRFVGFAIATASAWAASQALAGDGFRSGPAPGKFIGGTLQPFVVNGQRGKDRFHCPVLQFELNPVLAIFVREGEGPPADEAMVLELLKKADDAVRRHEELSFLKSFAVFVTPDAHNSITQPRVEDVKKLIAQTQASDKLVKRLRATAEPLKHVVVGTTVPERAKGWALANEPGVTVILYAKHRVLDTFAFPEGKLTEGDVNAIIKRVDERMKELRKGGAVKDKAV